MLYRINIHLRIICRGMQLLGKEGVLGQVQSGTTVEDIQKILCEEYERIKKDRREKKF